MGESLARNHGSQNLRVVFLAPRARSQVAWMFSLFCQFDHPLSLARLAVSAGLFVQGCAVYRSAGISRYSKLYYTYTQDIGWLECHVCGGGYETCASSCKSPPLAGAEDFAECWEGSGGVPNFPPLACASSHQES